MVAKNSGDVEKIFIDKSLCGKLTDKINAGGLCVRYISFSCWVEHSLSKHGLETPLNSKVFVLSFCLRLCSFVHGARSMNTLYFSIMGESSNSNVSVSHSTMLFKD
jgi:hypothetical protein